MSARELLFGKDGKQVDTTNEIGKYFTGNESVINNLNKQAMSAVTDILTKKVNNTSISTIQEIGIGRDLNVEALGDHCQARADFLQSSVTDLKKEDKDNINTTVATKMAEFVTNVNIVSAIITDAIQQAASEKHTRDIETAIRSVPETIRTSNISQEVYNQIKQVKNSSSKLAECIKTSDVFISNMDNVYSAVQDFVVGRDVNVKCLGDGSIATADVTQNLVNNFNMADVLSKTSNVSNDLAAGVKDETRFSSQQKEMASLVTKIVTDDTTRSEINGAIDAVKEAFKDIAGAFNVVWIVIGVIAGVIVIGLIIFLAIFLTSPSASSNVASVASAVVKGGSVPVMMGGCGCSGTGLPSSGGEKKKGFWNWIFS